MPAEDFNIIVKRISQALGKFNRGIPDIQKGMLESILEELRKLDLNNGKIKPTVANIKLFSSIRAKLNRLILTDDYVAEVKEFVKAFSDITKLQNDYWRTVEKSFTPKTLLKEIKKQAIGATVEKLTEAGIGANISDKISDILRSNITSGGSYRSLEGQLRELLTDTKKSDGLVSKYTKQITVDSVNQYNAQYTQIVSSDLGMEWFAYQGSDIETTRPFCDAMTDIRYFHVSQVKDLLKATDLFYENKKTGKREKVPIYSKTGLPHGMIDGTNPENFFIRRGGYNCQHQIRPVSESLVPATAKAGRNIEIAKKEKKDSAAFYQDKNGKYTVERQKLHKDIINQELSEGSTKTGYAYMLGGAPANGKSTLIDSGKLPHPKGILKIDPDKVKAQLPEYQKMTKDKDYTAAAFAHEESSDISKSLVKTALSKNLDVLTDGIGDGTLDRMQAKIKQYRDAGLKVRADYVTLDTKLSLKLANDRAIKTGRKVPDQYIKDMNREISKLIPQMLKAQSVDELFLWDTNINGKPRLILSQKAGKTDVFDQDLYDNFLKKADE